MDVKKVILLVSISLALVLSQAEAHDVGNVFDELTERSGNIYDRCDFCGGAAPGISKKPPVMVPNVSKYLQSNWEPDSYFNRWDLFNSYGNDVRPRYFPGVQKQIYAPDIVYYSHDNLRPVEDKKVNLPYPNDWYIPPARQSVSQVCKNYPICPNYRCLQYGPKSDDVGMRILGGNPAISSGTPLQVKREARGGMIVQPEYDWPVWNYSPGQTNLDTIDILRKLVVLPPQIMPDSAENILSIIPGFDNLRRKTREISDETDNQQEVDPLPDIPQEGDDLGVKILGGNAAISSGTPMQIKARMGKREI